MRTEFLIGGLERFPCYQIAGVFNFSVFCSVHCKHNNLDIVVLRTPHSEKNEIFLEKISKTGNAVLN